MNRRDFLSLAALAIAGKAAERVFPFRVYSIPKKIVVAKWDQSMMTPPSSFQIPPEMLNATLVHIYSSDFKTERGAFLARLSDGKVIGDVPEGTQPGDVLVLEATSPSRRRILNIGANCHRPFKPGHPRSGVFLDLDRA